MASPNSKCIFRQRGTQRRAVTTLCLQQRMRGAGPQLQPQPKILPLNPSKPGTVSGEEDKSVSHRDQLQWASEYEGFRHLPSFSQGFGAPPRATARNENGRDSGVSPPTTSPGAPLLTVHILPPAALHRILLLQGQRLRGCQTLQFLRFHPLMVPAGTQGWPSAGRTDSEAWV